jgi:hypothetical protein
LFSGIEIKTNEVDGARDTNEELKRHIEDFDRGNFRERDHLEIIQINGRITLIHVCKKLDGRA